MSKYRILKNEDHFIVQYRVLFFWKTFKKLLTPHGPSVDLRFSTKMQAEEKVTQEIKRKQQERKENSKYKVIKNYTLLLFLLMSCINKQYHTPNVETCVKMDESDCVNFIIKV